MFCTGIKVRDKYSTETKKGDKKRTRVKKSNIVFTLNQLEKDVASVATKKTKNVRTNNKGFITRL